MRLSIWTLGLPGRCSNGLGVVAQHRPSSGSLAAGAGLITVLVSRDLDARRAVAAVAVRILEHPIEPPDADQHAQRPQATLSGRLRPVVHVGRFRRWAP